MNMYIDKKSPIPVYYQLKSIITDKIRQGEYLEGSSIPSERELCEVLNISRMTVRQALNNLVNEGVLYREKGRGTFVARSKIEQKNIMSFSDTVAQKGMVPSTKILYFGKEEADETVRGILGLKDNSQIYNIKRLRLANNIPVGIEQDFIPEAYCPGLEKFNLTSSLYKILRDEFQHVIDYIDNSVEASKPSREEKELLNLAVGIPVLKIKSQMHTESGLNLLYERSVYRSDEYKYHIRVYGNKGIE
jgi:GntR family transcriptional regulator